MLIQRTISVLAIALLIGHLCAEDQTKNLLDFDAAHAATRLDLKANNATGQVECNVVTDKGNALDVTIQPGAADYPGINIKPEGGKWDLSAFGHIEARLVNTGLVSLALVLRVDNAGDWRTNPWNTEIVTLKPGESKTIRVVFGLQYGLKPGFALKSDAIVNLLFCTGKTKDKLAFRMESLTAGGTPGEKPPLDPNLIRFKPRNGILFGPGAAAWECAVEIDRSTIPWSTYDPKTPPNIGFMNVEIRGNGLTSHGSTGMVFPHAKGYIKYMAGAAELPATLAPYSGRWDLREAVEMRVKLQNIGDHPVTPSVQVLSNGGPTDTITADAPLAPDAETELIVPFAPAKPWKGVPVTKAGFYGGQKGTGTPFTSDAVSGVNIFATGTDANLRVESIIVDCPPAPLPEWLGKRPPVEGDWVQTFNDDFEGTAVDQTKWSFYGVNYWDKISHWSKDNTTVANGVVTLRYEKKTGFHNDDKRNNKEGGFNNLTGKSESDYQSGFLETYGKFAQRYGYFEARMKLPTAPGLWCGFWMMPDRGEAAGGMGPRQDTNKGGMEFDIMEHLDRWGGNRYNIAMHWDGYQKDHASIGNQNTYARPDKDGFITCGLLWLPGQAVYYANGVEVGRWESSRISNIASDMMFTFNAGGWDNDALDDKKLPSDFVIDYVRVWQRKDLK